MTGRQSNGPGGSASVGKRRGRPPKTATMERPKKFQYHLMKKPKYLCKDGQDGSSSTPSASRASSPHGSEESRPSTSRRTPAAKGTRGRKSTPRGRPSGRGRGGHNNSSARKGKCERKWSWLVFFCCVCPKTHAEYASFSCIIIIAPKHNSSSVRETGFLLFVRGATPLRLCACVCSFSLHFFAPTAEPSF